MRIEVRDSGAGLAPENLQRLLLPFHLLQPSFPRGGPAAPGSGFTSAVPSPRPTAGRLLLDSTPGQGTAVTLVLPRGRVVEASSSLKLAQETP